jgi:hypothetical protein
MAPVLLAVGDVVDDVDGAGHETKCGEGHGDPLGGGEVADAPGEDGRQQDQAVLGPLSGPHRPNGIGHLAEPARPRNHRGGVQRGGERAAGHLRRLIAWRIQPHALLTSKYSCQSALG